MSRIEWLVAIAGGALIVWINWYFFLAGKGGTTRAVAPTDAP
jgi:hypothetical protein